MSMSIQLIENKLDSLLSNVINYSDLKLFMRWVKILTALHSKECKGKSPNLDILNKLYITIIEIGENIIYLIDCEDDESLIYLGPNLFESLIKIKNTILEHEHYLESLSQDNNSKNIGLQLTPSQIESLNKIKQLI